MTNFFTYQVYKDGKWIDLFLERNPRFASSLNNPVFRRQSIPGFFTIPFDAPVRGNAAILGHPEQSNNKSNQFNCIARVKLGDVTLCCGQIKVLKASYKKYRLTFQDNQGVFKDLVENKSIRDLCTQMVQIPCEVTDQVKIKLSPVFGTPDPNVFPNPITINGQTYTFVFVSAFDQDDYMQELVSQINADPGQTASAVFFGGCVLVEDSINTPIIIDSLDPNSDLWFIDDRLNLLLDFGDCMQDFLNANLANEANEPYVFPVIQNQSAYNSEDGSETYSGYVNYFYDGTYLVNSDESTAFAYPVSPQVKFTYVKECIEAATGFELKGEFWELPEVDKLLFYNNVLLDREGKVEIYGNLGGTPDTFDANFYNLNFDIADHLPDITIQQFFDFIQKKFGVVFKFDKFSKCIEFNLYNDIATKSAIEDWSELVCSPGEICYDQKRGYTFKHTKPKGDQKEQESDYIVEGGENTILTGFSTLSQFSGFDTNNFRRWKTPCVLDVATTPLFGIGENDFGTQIYFWNGLQNDSINTPYPLGSTDNLNFDGEVLCDFSLNWASTDEQVGTYEYFWEKWTNKDINGKDINVKLRPSLKFLAKYDHCTPFFIRIDDVQQCVILKSLGLNADECNFIEGNAKLRTI